MPTKSWSLRILQKGSLANLKLEIAEIPVDHVLVKMECSTVNPSNIWKTMGYYPSADPPLTAGAEGFGTVIKSGGGAHADSLVGKRAAVATLLGTWTQYAIVHSNNVYPGLSFIRASRFTLCKPANSSFYARKSH